ncbi:spore cortex biosynthesis protein YabQ [Robertmurraya yapensis]|uniref:Spore cortex biosynthesis protein YabQ n=2 Tax=Bacillaceae TaxID=186817 RepID=A0A3S0I380_9BACI|nr:spore cortex biosynthesis protein YabQ [Bacillus yapensis]RTR26419.1 spore cortex biosynthesis protein YabQ [Bacillus yapensis]TKS93690.1 spore cortex biosynthesis protein YabQ [Bacillus yapensis]
MTLSTQFLTMIAMIGMGSYFGAALDTYNRFLQRSKRQSWLVFINDILFWFLQGLSIFYVLFLVNKGELRFYIFLALLCGFAAYQSLLKRGYLRLLEIVISMVISIYRFFVKAFHLLIYKPIYSIVLAIISLIIMLGKGLYALVKWICKVLLSVIRVFLKPFGWLMILLWNLLPKKIKKMLEKLYNKFAGFFQKTKNIIIKLLSKWKKYKK